MIERPKIAIVDPNTFSALGLKSMLQNVMPIMTVDIFGSFAELESGHPEAYFHYFTAMSIVLEHKEFFLARRRKTIVLTISLGTMSQLSDFHCLCVNVPEPQLVHSLLALEQRAHGDGKNLPPMPDIISRKILTNREIAGLYQQGDCRAPQYWPRHCHHPPKEHYGQVGTPECLSAHDLRRYARVRGH